MVLPCALLGLVSRADATTTITFTLGSAYTTSAGVYKTDGTLIRTLWRKVDYTAGPHTVTWDDKDDSGAVVAAGTYQIRVLTHNVNYNWDGVIGNTSAAFTGLNIWRGLYWPSDMAIDGTNGFIARNYNEGQPLINRITTSAPQSPAKAVHNDSFSNFKFVATDGTWYYAANVGGSFGGEATTFVTAFNVSDDSASNFTNGTTVYLNGTYPDQTWPNCIDISTTPGTANPNQPTGIAVQKTGSVLAVSHGYLNQIKLFDKRGGNLTGTISVTNPQRVAFAPNGDLWVITGTTLQRFAAATLGSTNTPATTISGFIQPVALAVHPSNNDIVLVADSGSSEQVKAYNRTGTSLWTYGQLGGNNSTPTISNDRFMFKANVSSDAAIGWAPQSYLAIQSDGSFWVSDPGNFRSLHISSARAYLEQIAFLPGIGRSSAVDLNNPNRIIGGSWLEYSMDYTKPLTPGDPSATGGSHVWTLVKNWTVGLDLSSFYNISTVATLSNGRTYALLGAVGGGFRVAELASTGIRLTPTTIGGNYDLASNGSLRYYTTASGVITWYQQALTGFDASGNPQWGTATTLASAPAGANDPWPHVPGCDCPTDQSGVTRIPITASNVLVSLNMDNNPGNHLGGVQLGASSWGWQAGPTGWLDGLGTFQTQAIDGTTNYPANHAMASGQNIVYGFNGEFYTDQATGQTGEANQFMHYWDDGLFIGQFGVKNIAASYPGGDVNNVPAGIAGNAFFPSFTQVNGATYLWHNDENTHGGIHRWTFNNASGIAEITGTGAKGGTIAVGQPDLIVTSVAWTPANPLTGQAAKFSAVVKNQGTGATAPGTILGVSFWIDGSPVNWEDTDTASLAPGASRTETATGGPSGTDTWTATVGTHTVWAIVDDVNRFAESNESNNQTNASMTVTNAVPVVALRLNENTGISTANNGSAGGSLALTSTVPAWTTNVPSTVGGASAVDFGTTTGNYAVESAAALPSLGGLSKFTITGWVNCKNSTEGSGGNRIVTWINNGGDGVDLVYRSDGSLQMGVDEWPDSSPARSSAAKIPTSSTAAAANWRFFAVSYDSTLASAQVKFYFGTTSANATLDSSPTYSGRGAVNTAIGRLALGHFNSATRAGATDRMFRGVIDNVKIYNDALSLGQIVQAQQNQ